MSKVLVTESYLGNIADAIRLKNGASTTYRPGDMAAAIEALDTSGIHPTGTKNITQNGTHDVTEYASANVNVQPTLQSKTVTQNGTVTPDQGYDGLSSVVVNVSGGGSSVDLSDYAELFKYVCLSDHSGDKFIRSSRYFTRNTAEPILALCAAYLSGGAAAYTGYAVIAFTNSIISGTYTSYGDLVGLTAKTTPNGTPYWVQVMNGMYPPSTANGWTQFNVGNNQMNIYTDVGGLIINGETKSLYGNADMISAMNALIDAIYLKYYAT